MGNDDSTMSILELRERQLIAADGIIGRCQQLCERVLYEQGDEADMSIVNLQHDCVSWNALWLGKPVTGRRVTENTDGVIPVNFNPENN